MQHVVVGTRFNRKTCYGISMGKCVRNTEGNGDMATKTKLGRVVPAILAICAMTAAFALVACSSPTANSDQSSLGVMQATDASLAAADQDCINVLFLGDDKWAKDIAGRPDLILLAHIDLKNHKITEVTIPRDTWVVKSDGSSDKLNMVLAGLSRDEQKKLIEEKTGLHVDYYAQIGFTGLENLVDGIGGLPINLPYSFDYHFYTNDYPDESYEAGQQTLSGWQAMVVSRARTGYSAHDLDNQDAVRQYVCREMLTNLIQYAYTGGVDHAADTLNKYKNLIETDMPLEDQVAVAKKLGETGTIEVVGTTGPFNGKEQDAANGLWLVDDDSQGWKKMAAAVNNDGDLEAAFKSFQYAKMPGDLLSVKTTLVKVD